MVITKLQVPCQNFGNMPKNIVERNFNEEIRTNINRKITV